MKVQLSDKNGLAMEVWGMRALVRADTPWSTMPACATNLKNWKALSPLQHSPLHTLHSGLFACTLRCPMTHASCAGLRKDPPRSAMPTLAANLKNWEGNNRTEVRVTRVVLHRTISNMIASMELQRPRATPVLPQWDLGVVLEALNKPPYEPLREASFKHLTLKTVFLLAMASAGRRSELRVLRFDQNYIQFKPKGAGVTLYLAQNSCARIKSRIKSTTPGIFQRSLLVNQNSALLTVL